MQLLKVGSYATERAWWCAQTWQCKRCGSTFTVELTKTTNPGGVLIEVAKTHCPYCRVMVTHPKGAPYQWLTNN